MPLVRPVALSFLLLPTERKTQEVEFVAIKHTPAHARQQGAVPRRHTAVPCATAPCTAEVAPRPTIAWSNDNERLDTDGAAFERADSKKQELVRKMRPTLPLRDPATDLVDDPAARTEWQRAPSQVQQLRQLKEQRAARGARQTTRDARIDALTRELQLGTQLKGSCDAGPQQAGGPEHATEARPGRTVLVRRRLDSGNVGRGAVMGCGAGYERQQPCSRSSHPAGRDCAYVNMAQVH